MPQTMNAVLSFGLALFISFALVPLLMRYATVLGLVDKPDGVRKVHTRVIPRSGGLAIALSVLISLFYFSSQVTEISYLLFGSIVIVLFGFLDDRYELNFKWKFFGQIIAVVIFLYGLQDVEKLPFYIDGLPQWFIYIVLFFFMLGVTNAVNLSDGLDGLAAGTVLLSLAFITYLGYESQIHCIYITSMALIGALLGFLRYNTHPARVFMGDTGSQFIGFVAASLALTTTQHVNSAVSPVLPLVIMGLPVLDTLMVMVIRLRQGRSPFSPDKNHLHHQLMHRGFYHHEAVAIIYVLQIVLILTAYFMRYESDVLLIIFYLSFSLLVMSAIFIGHRLNWAFRPEVIRSGMPERRNLIFRKFTWLYLYNSKILAVCCGLAWGILVFSKSDSGISLNLLAQIALMLTLLIAVFLPRFTQMSTRIAAYSASTFALFPFSISNATLPSISYVNGLMLVIALLLILSIRVTRREHFRLDNQDILILFILMVTPLLPIDETSNIDLGAILFKLAILLYATEYIVSKEKGRHLLLNGFALLTLFSISIGF